MADLDVLRRELAFFSEELASKPQLIAATKMDAVTDDAGQVGALEARARELDVPFFRISSAAGTGLDALVEAAWSHIAAARIITAPEPRTGKPEPGTLNPEP